MPSKKKKQRRLRKRRSNRKQHNGQNNISEFHANFESSEPETLTPLPTFDNEALVVDMTKLSVSADSIEDCFFILGEGSFGLVTVGHLQQSNGKRVKVALKAANDTQYDFLIVHEAEILSQLDHPNVVRILAVQTDPLKIALEYMEMGDILDALKRHLFTDRDLLNALHEIALGMEYIAQKHYVHRDLACRNVFVNNKRQCKIGDFGLCQYVGDSDGVLRAKELPVCNTFCAPEVVETKKFTTKCDVWSMGLLVWELYFTASRDIPVILKRIFLECFCLMRESLPRPTLCPQDLHLYMKKRLLNEDPNHRPNFTEVKEKINQYISD